MDGFSQKERQQQASRGDFHHAMDSKPTSPSAVEAPKSSPTAGNEPQTIVIALDASQEAEHAVNCKYSLFFRDVWNER